MSEEATHRCTYCGALWKKCNDPACVPALGKDHWHLRSDRCGSCCDNAPMGHQIVPLSPRAAAPRET